MLPLLKPRVADYDDEDDDDDDERSPGFVSVSALGRTEGRSVVSRITVTILAQAPNI